MNDDLINSLLMCLIKRGIPIDDIRMEYQIILNKYNVLPAEKSVVVYSEGKNKMLARRFLIAKTVAGCSERTTQYYGKVLEFIFDKISKDVDTWEPDDIRYYMAVRARDGVSKTTINNERRVLSSLFGWLQREELITRNPMLKIEQIKTTKQKKEAFTQMEIEKIRAACRSKAETAMVETLLSTGCRVSIAKILFFSLIPKHYPLFFH